jgi:catechol 2,3-dioxygenase-like lactoylglutathione lyase family enzyme
MAQDPIKPIRFSHAVFKSYDVERMRNWYMAVLGAHVAFEALPMVCFLAYDGEHHRIGIGRLQGDPIENVGRAPGLAHLGCTFADVTTLLRKYEQLRDIGITPQICINHGPTISFYYLDPDGNGVELLMDRFATLEGAAAFMESPVFQKNYNGLELDPEDMLSRMKAGASEQDLAVYDENSDQDMSYINEKFSRVMREL